MRTTLSPVSRPTFRSSAAVLGVAALGLAGCGAPPATETADTPEVDTRTSAILNGTNVTAAQNPATVGVYHNFPRPCSGTLLRPTWVLTARHCLTLDTSPTGTFQQPSQIRVAPPSVVTATNNGINPGNFPPASAVTARRLLDYDVNIDLALIELTSALPSQNGPMGLWNGETADLLNRPVRLMGYGRSNTLGNEDDGSSGAGTLRMGDSTVDQVFTMFMHSSDSLQGGPLPATDHGDSGGPTYALTDRFGRNLFGLAGWHIENLNDDGTPTSFRNWIERMIKPPGSVRGSLAPDIALVGGIGWQLMYWATSQGAAGTFTQSSWTWSAFASAAAKFGVRPVAGDFNGDRNLDILLVGGVGSTLPIATSNGNGTFTYNTSTVSPPGFAGLSRTGGSRPIAGDFNGDGRTDVALIGGNGFTTIPVAWSGTTWTSTNTAVTDFPGWSAQAGVQTVAGDFDGDGRDDLALVGGAGWGSIPLALSNGDGTFNVIVDGVGDFPGWAQQAGVKAVSGDFNGDGRDDVALVGGPGWATIPIAFSAGDGTFWVTNEPVADFPGFAQTSGAKALTADFDQDGREDIALVGGSGWSTVPVAFSVGDGTFRVTNGAAGSFPSSAQVSNATPLTMRAGQTKRVAHPAVEIVVARNANGRLDAFTTGVDTLIYHQRQLAWGGGWSGEIWQGGAAKKLALAQDQDGRLELFYIGTDDHLWHRWQTSPGVWAINDTQLGGSTAAQIAVGRNADGRLEVFYTRLSDNAIFHNYQLAPNSAWSGEQPMDGGAKRLTVESGVNGLLALFVVGLDDAIWLRQQLSGGGWGGWNPLGGNAKELAAAHNTDGRLMVFYITGPLAPFGANWIRSNGQLSPNGAWSGDSTFSAAPVRALKVATARNDDGRIELLFSSSDSGGTIKEYYQPAANGSFTGPVSGTNAQPVKGIAAAAPTDSGPLEVFYLGHEGAIQTDAHGSGPTQRSADRLIGDELGVTETRLCIMTDEYQTASVSCPAGQIIEYVSFASYGLPTGTCGIVDNAFSIGSCHATTSQRVVEEACVGKPSCTIDVSNATFGGDPCAGSVKKLFAFLRCL